MDDIKTSEDPDAILRCAKQSANGWVCSNLPPSPAFLNLEEEGCLLRVGAVLEEFSDSGHSMLWSITDKGRRRASEIN